MFRLGRRLFCLRSRLRRRSLQDVAGDEVVEPLPAKANRTFAHLRELNRRSGFPALVAATIFRSPDVVITAIAAARSFPPGQAERIFHFSSNGALKSGRALAGAGVAAVRLKSSKPGAWNERLQEK
jgi:hypothetical protein